jgi:phage/plasmid-like protein (TIGR03299 family)
MSHNLNIRNGRASMFYINEVPWHHLGTRLDAPATADEAIEAAQLDYTVQKRPLRAVLTGRRTIDVPNHYATVRTDLDNAVLGVVGSRYEVISNTKAFSFFDGLVERSEAIYHTAGVLGKGERCWILARLPGYIRVGKNDPIEKFVLLVNSHDGSTPTLAKLTNVRVVCQNTLSTALAGSDQSVSVRHTANSAQKLEDAHKLMGLYNSLYRQLEYIFNRMALKNITGKQLVEYANILIPANEEAESTTRTDNIREMILNLHESGKGAETTRGTVWGAYNAIAEYTDHVASSHNPQKQLKSIWFGSGEKLKQRAFQLAQDMLLN